VYVVSNTAAANELIVDVFKFTGKGNYQGLKIVCHVGDIEWSPNKILRRVPEGLSGSRSGFVYGVENCPA